MREKVRSSSRIFQSRKAEVGSRKYIKHPFNTSLLVFVYYITSDFRFPFSDFLIPSQNQRQPTRAIATYNNDLAIGGVG